MKKRDMAVMFIVLALTLILVSSCSRSDCEKYDYDTCPKGCVICPPCENCSSVGCHTEKFCRSIGFDKDWFTSE